MGAHGTSTFVQPKGPKEVPMSRFLLGALAMLAAGTVGVRAESPSQPAVAAQVKEIFRSRCLECHGGSKTEAGVRVLDRDALVGNRKKVLPGRPNDSPLFEAITAAADDARMPPSPLPRLDTEEIDAVRRWIADGAPPFPADVPAPAEKD